MFEFLTITSLAFSCDPSLGFCVRVSAGEKISNIAVVGVQSTAVCLKNEGTTDQFLRLSPNSQGWRVELGPDIRRCQDAPVLRPQRRDITASRNHQNYFQIGGTLFLVLNSHLNPSKIIQNHPTIAIATTET